MTIELMILLFFIFIILQQLQGKLIREEMRSSIKAFEDTLSHQILSLTQTNEQRLEEIKTIVDEKLHNTLTKHLGDSFRLVSERLELLYKGLGEMQVLTNGIFDLKKVLSDVKARGIWGEIQLSVILEEILIPSQYARNVITKIGGKDRVEFAIKLPGRKDEVVWLPIDAKFPKEDYERLLEAIREGDKVLVEKYSKDLENTIKRMAKDIQEKYISPPSTTDFGILFLPAESLYAEVIRRPGLFDYIQREYRIIIAGPTILAALLNSLQMGFRTLAIEKKHEKIWHFFISFKTEFSKFASILDKTYNHIQMVSRTIDEARRESRNIQKSLEEIALIPSFKDDNISCN